MNVINLFQSPTVRPSCCWILQRVTHLKNVQVRDTLFAFCSRCSEGCVQPNKDTQSHYISGALLQAFWVSPNNELSQWISHQHFCGPSGSVLFLLCLQIQWSTYLSNRSPKYHYMGIFEWVWICAVANKHRIPSQTCILNRYYHFLKWLNLISLARHSPY